jgi:hypothetical protein
MEEAGCGEQGEDTRGITQYSLYPESSILYPKKRPRLRALGVNRGLSLFQTSG